MKGIQIEAETETLCETISTTQGGGAVGGTTRSRDPLVHDETRGGTWNKKVKAILEWQPLQLPDAARETCKVANIPNTGTGQILEWQRERQLVAKTIGLARRENVSGDTRLGNRSHGAAENQRSRGKVFTMIFITPQRTIKHREIWITDRSEERGVGRNLTGREMTTQHSETKMTGLLIQIRPSSKQKGKFFPLSSAKPFASLLVTCN